MAHKVHPEQPGREPGQPLNDLGLPAPAMRALEVYCKLVAATPARVGLIVVVVSLVLSGLPFAFWGTDALELDLSLDAFEVRGNIIASRMRAYEAGSHHYYYDDDDWRRLGSRNACHGGGCEAARRLLSKQTLGSNPQLAKTNGTELKSAKKRRLFDSGGDIVVIYSAKDGESVLTEQRLQQALQLERKVAGILHNEPYTSPLTAIFPAYPSSTGTPTGSALEARLTMMAELVHDTRHEAPGGWPQFDKEFSACNLDSKLLSSSFMYWGSSAISDELASFETDDLEVAFFPSSNEWFDTERDENIERDMMLLIGAVLGVLVLMGIFTSSAFLAFMGLIAIILSTGITVFVYRIFVSKWLGVLNMFAFFLLLGIGCDDVFVLVDTWRQSAESKGIQEDDYVARLSYVLPRAGSSIFTTSLTTAVAFFGNAISVIPPMRLFGVFSGLMVLLDFTLTMFFLPSMLVLQHRLFGGLGCVRCKARKPDDTGDSNNGDGNGMGDKLMRQLPKIFRFAPVWVLLGCVLLGVSLNVALELPPGEAFHSSELFPSWHNQARAYEAQQSMKNLRQEHVVVRLVWGVKPEDTGDMNNPASTTDAVWDSSFNPKDPRVQEFTVELCAALVADRALVKSLETCWAQKVKDYAIREGRAFPETDEDHLRHSYALTEVGDNLWKGEIIVVATVQGTALIRELQDHYDRWEAFMDKWNNEAKRRGIPAQNGFQTSWQWVHMSTINDMMTSCIAASCISTACVAVMLSLTLRNFVVVGLAVLHVIGVCLSLIATFVMEGRVLGVLESIAATLLVGLSVDYLAHVSSAYLAEPADKPREQKALATIHHLGRAVMAGALTTIVSAIFLCFGLILFFSTFGSFIIRMIAFSLFATLLCFVSSLYLFGPEGSCGQIPCPQRCRGQPTDVPEATHGDAAIPATPMRMRVGTCVGTWIILLVASIVCLVRNLPKSADAPVCPDIDHLNFTFEGYAIGPERDSYRCRGFDHVPQGCTYYVHEIEPIVGHSMVHHMVLMDVQSKADSCPFTCFDMPNAVGIQATWAIGINNVKWPEGTATLLGDLPLALQMHYFNPTLLSDQVDTRSGLMLKVTKQKPENMLRNLVIGLHPEGSLEIPPGIGNLTRSATCVPSLLGDVTVVAFSTHAHKLGRRIVTEVSRRATGASAPTVVGDVGSTLFYDFDYQRFEMFPLGEERTLSAGDSVRITCTFDSTSRTGVTGAGYGSEDEMCMTFLMVYPATNLLSTNCLVNAVDIDMDEWDFTNE